MIFRLAFATHVELVTVVILNARLSAPTKQTATTDQPLLPVLSAPAATASPAATLGSARPASPALPTRTLPMTAGAAFKGIMVTELPVVVSERAHSKVIAVEMP